MLIHSFVSALPLTWQLCLTIICYYNFIIASGNGGCPVLNIDNGAVTYTDETEIGSVALITCNEQFVLRGANNRKCQSNGNWTGENAVCQPQISGIKCIE